MAHVGAQEVAAFASPGFAQLLAIQLAAQAGDFFAPGLFALAGAALMMLDGQLHEAGVAAGLFLRRADGLMQIIALHQGLALRDVLERLEIHAQSPLPHGALFFDSILTLGEHIRFTLVRQQFDAHAGARLLPVAREQWLLQRGEPTLGRAHQIAHRRRAAAHLPEDFLRGDAAIHDPHTLGLAILIFDLGEEVFERRFVRRVSRQHFISKRITLGCDDERDDDLHAVAALVTTVAEAAQTGGLVRRITFKISARQVVEEHLILRIKQVAPALSEMVKERALVLQQLVVARVEAVLFGESEVTAEQVANRAVIKPMPVQTPFAARVNQTVEDQRLQHQIPACALAAGRQVFEPKGIQAQLPPQLAAQPAGTPLARTTQRHL